MLVVQHWLAFTGRYMSHRVEHAPSTYTLVIGSHFYKSEDDLYDPPTHLHHFVYIDTCVHMEMKASEKRE